MSTVKIEGLDKLRRNLAKFDKNLQKKIYRKATREASKPVVQAIKARAPVSSGVMRRSITARAAHKPGAGLYGMKAAVRGGTSGPGGEPVRYYRFVEAGTYKDPKQPFLLPGLEAGKGAFLRILKSRLSAAIESEGNMAR